MPTYDFECLHKHQFEQYLSFAEYDACKGQIKCTKCDCPAKIVTLEAGHGHVVNRNTFGKQAEINSKKLGKYGVEDKQLEDAKKRKPKKERKTPWYGQLGESNVKKIFNETDKKKKKEKIDKYVTTGEI